MTFELLNSADAEGRTALHLAVAAQAEDLVLYMLQELHVDATVAVCTAGKERGRVFRADSESSQQTGQRFLD